MVAVGSLPGVSGPITSSFHITMSMVEGIRNIEAEFVALWFKTVVLSELVPVVSNPDTYPAW